VIFGRRRTHLEDLVNAANPMKDHPRARRTAAAAAAAVAVAAAAGLAAALALPGPAASASPLPRQVVSGIRPAWAASSADKGPVPARTKTSVRVYLAGQDPAGLTRYAGQVSDPGNPGYRHYLTPAQFERRFGPTGTQISAVESWLTGAGLSVTASNENYVAASGTAAALQTAFGSRLDRYRTAQGTLQAPQSAVTVPAGVASAVLTVTGLSADSARPQTELTGAVPSPINEGACSAYWGQQAARTLPRAYGRTLDYDLCGYLPAQLRTAYGASATGLTGKGVTIAIVDQGSSPTIVSDVNTYSSRHGGQPLRPGQLAKYLPADIGRSCAAMNTQPEAYGEESLDVEAAHAMAPDARIDYVGADCANDPAPLLDALTRIVDGHLADIVSDSWHLGTEAQVTPATVTAFERVFEQGAIEGIGFYFAAGDSGDYSAQTPNHKPAVQYPASDPWVTSVGGTSLAVGPAGRYEWETGWGTDLAPLAANGKRWTSLPGSFQQGGGGGASALFAQPFYQRGIVPGRLSHPGGASAAVRVIPDIAADADPSTGLLVGFTTPLTPGGTPQYIEGVGGGTSQSTPLIAGLQADAQQAQGGVPIGFANPAIYARYGGKAYHDVTDRPLGPRFVIAAVYAERDPATGTITNLADTFAADTSLHATPGYDDVTGVGTPAGGYLDSYRAR
jgi:subtilase family serine protease